MMPEMVDSVVYTIDTKIVDSSAPSPQHYGNKHTLEALYEVRLAIFDKIDDKSVICQGKHLM